MPGKKILVLGSGIVAKPCVDYLLRNKNNILTIGQAIALDFASPELDHYIADHDLVISLVPFVHHAAIVRSAIKGRANVVTTSYVSPAIRELEDQAKEAGITVLNEVGVDPGIDHLYAIKTIGEVHEKGGNILEFYSYCGGLPAPEASDNPLRFKVVEISSKYLMTKAVPYHVLDGYSFLAYPNRDSVLFQQAYGIPEAHTVIRGSLRYEGNPALVKTLIDLGWLDTGSKAWLKESMTWSQIQQQLTGAASTAEVDLVAKVDGLCCFRSPEEREKILAGLKRMRLFSDDVATIRDSPLDTLCAQLDKLCGFQLEYDHVYTRTLWGASRLLSHVQVCRVTCGIATQLLLDGDPAFNKPGVIAPYSKEICDPIRARVEAEGIKLVERAL
ncbi:hypothetical protein IL306_003790 [Fusarium sp. DS 682]|nr:hypothetical protein IL306_003790 [Fusarium sp. DS 682]